MNKYNFIELGSKILYCDKSCEGIVNNREEGIIPRILMLSTITENQPMELFIDKRPKLGVFGLNPGHHLPFENIVYKNILCKDASKNEIFKEIHKLWLEIFLDSKNKYMTYFKNILAFLRASKDLFHISEDDTILWGEVVYCESEINHGLKDKKQIPESTFKTCIGTYMDDVLKLIEGDILICTGYEAFEKMKKYIEKSNKTVLGIYHPSGSRGRYNFNKYFNEDKSELSSTVIKEIKEFLTNKEPLFLRLK